MFSYAVMYFSHVHPSVTYLLVALIPTISLPFHNKVYFVVVVFCLVSQWLSSCMHFLRLSFYFYFCAPCTCHVSEESRWRCQLPWDWSYRWLWAALGCAGTWTSVLWTSQSFESLSHLSRLTGTRVEIYLQEHVYHSKKYFTKENVSSSPTSNKIYINPQGGLRSY